MSSWLVPLMVGFVGVVGTLIATKMTTRSSRNQLYVERMREENIRQIEHTKEDFNLYNKRLTEVFNEEDIDKRVESVSELRSLRNKINLYFPAFNLPPEINLYKNKTFDKYDEKSKDNECDADKLHLMKRNPQYKNEISEISVDSATFLIMSQLESLLEREFRESNNKAGMNEDEMMKFAVPHYLESLIDILFKLQQSIYHLRRLAVEEREDVDFKFSKTPKIIKYLKEVENNISKEYKSIHERISIEEFEKQEMSSDEGSNKKSRKLNFSVNEPDIEKYIFNEKEIENNSVANIVTNTLDKLLDDNLNLTIPWKPPSAKSKRFLVNYSFHHSDGKKFMNPKLFKHRKLKQEIYFESHSSKVNIHSLLVQYINHVLEENRK